MIKYNNIIFMMKDAPCNPGFSSYGSATSAEADAFIIATGISDSTQITAIRELVNNLIGYGLWVKMKAIYPFIGGTATTHKYNLKDPQDLDAAFRLQFFGTITHSSGGIKSDGTTGYANTFFIPSVNLTINNGHWSFYSRTNVNETKYDIGSTDSGSKFNSLITRFNGLFYASYTNSYTDNVSTPDSLGFYIVNRILTNTIEGFKNNLKIINNTRTGVLSDRPFYILAENNVGITANYSNKQGAFASFGDGLTKCDAYYFYQTVQLYQTTLGRQV